MNGRGQTVKAARGRLARLSSKRVLTARKRTVPPEYAAYRAGVARTRYYRM